ncbi:UvrD-helicase domain-containing protein [Caballeronia sp. ATUFL_F2_KS9A]|uniref:UvrD-helicase domain-containing protein n=1 Tax=Caballeronia sp. ATUFL_F2_KS9A TaxID=2921777 RepID=UPI0020276D4D|nr:UvrD-helicase domain-containing protein [Caballeronia sp. ATUFL_F2_KS9A]
MNSRCDVAFANGFLPNPEQRTVLEARVNDWLLVEAGPGTGKTQIAAMRLAHLLQQGLRPAQILVLSFSRSAVAALMRRIASLTVQDEAIVEDLRHLAIRTFDAWAFRMLRQNGVDAADLLRRSHDENIASVTKELGAETPFGDRLSTIRHVIVDEFQDLPGVRAEMVMALLRHLNPKSEKRCGFTVLGDPAQSIYRFAARSENGLAPADPWAGLRQRMGPSLREIALIQNHRATKQLAAMAAGLRKTLGTSSIDADAKLAAMKRFLGDLPLFSTDEKLGAGVRAQLPQHSMAILTRTNGEALRVWQMLMGHSDAASGTEIRLRLAGGVPSAPAWIAALLSTFRPRSMTRTVFDKVYQRLCSLHDEATIENLGLPSADAAWQRLTRASGASETATFIDLDSLNVRLDWPDAFPEDEKGRPAAVLVTTVHQAKGMEFDSVALLEVNPRNADKKPVWISSR